MVIGGLHGRNRLEGDDRQALELASRYRERFLTELRETRCGLLRERVHAPGGLGSCSMVVACPGRQARERAARNLFAAAE